jgi:hypothetical protein
MLVSLIIVLVIVGVALYLVELLPMDATLKLIIRVLIILVLLLWLLQTLGVLGPTLLLHR